VESAEAASAVPAFTRSFFDPARRLTRIGAGSLGGKALGLIDATAVLSARRRELDSEALAVDVPAMLALGTGLFDAFLERNDLARVFDEEWPDERVAQAFRQASMPAERVGDLRAVAAEVKVPLAVRSSSALEDALGQPFAGVYGTKMISCWQHDPASRFQSLLDAIKFVYASTFFHGARAYLRASRRRLQDEKMAVVVQEVVGRKHAERFYPDVSGVARSFNFYPAAGARPQDGVVDLALGLGKTIVDGGRCWTFSPARPRSPPPFASARDLVAGTQATFWAVHTGSPPAYDPMAEAEHLVRGTLADAESDGALRYAASTYDAQADRLVPGIGRAGARVLDFAPLLQRGEIPLVRTLRALLAACEEAAGRPVEIEFALSLPPEGRARLGLLQVRSLMVPGETVELGERDLAGEGVLVASTSALGNGRRTVEDVVYVEPSAFDAGLTRAVAEEIAALNGPLVEAGRPYLLLGFGRWGSSEPWLGIPVRWDQVAGAKAIVEAALPHMSPEPSQGSHFFHNLSSFEVFYFTVPPAGPPIDWDWLGKQPIVARTEHVRHVRARGGLSLEVDGRSRRGVVRRPPEP
jgi:Pyruvate phosphate dikinase, AMP/ATP-binding domain